MTNAGGGPQLATPKASMKDATSVKSTPKASEDMDDITDDTFIFAVISTKHGVTRYSISIRLSKEIFDVKERKADGERILQEIRKTVEDSLAEQIIEGVPTSVQQDLLDEINHPMRHGIVICKYTTNARVVPLRTDSVGAILLKAHDRPGDDEIMIRVDFPFYDGFKEVLSPRMKPAPITR